PNLNLVVAVLLLQVSGSAETFDAIRQLEDGALVVPADDRTLVYRANSKDRLERIPRVFFQVLVAQCQPAVGSVKLEYHNLHFIANLNELGRMLDLLRPAQVRYVHKAVDAFFEFNEQTEVGQITDNTLVACTHGVLGEDILARPRIFGELLDAQRHLPLLAIQRQDDSLNFVTHFHEVLRVTQVLRPAHF